MKRSFILVQGIANDRILESDEILLELERRRVRVPAK